ncbi:MAG: DUF1549 domain-containing protein [Acidobacteria bacterium]|nr:DUF1549 domain-containing protein [Acidobacteriota bacterium]
MPICAAILIAALAGSGTAQTAAGVFEGRAGPGPQAAIDELVFGKLERLGIRPANPCSDAVFLRRAYLDVIGTLPTSAEAGSFLQDRSPDKRRALIDQLLRRDEFADYWAMKWGDLLRIKAEFPINLRPNAVQAYHRWVRTCIHQNVPYDRFVREMLTSNGGNFRVPPPIFAGPSRAGNPKPLRGRWP